MAFVRVSLEGSVSGWAHAHPLYACMSTAHTHLDRDTSGHREAFERLATAAAVVAATPRSRAVELWPPPAMAATIERPVRVGEGCD